MRRRLLWLVLAAAVALPLSACAASVPLPPEPPEPLLERYQKPGGLDTLPRVADLESHEPPCETIPILPPLDRYDCMILEAVMHEGHGIPPREIKAEIRAESGGRERVVSHAGAVGLMQLMPGTFRQMLPRGDIHDPEQNIRAGVKYRVWCAMFWHAGLRSEAERFGPLSLGCYNAGPGGMLDAQGVCGGYTWAEIGPCAPRETRDYVMRIEGMEAGKPWGFWHP